MALKKSNLTLRILLIALLTIFIIGVLSGCTLRNRHGQEFDLKLMEKDPATVDKAKEDTSKKQDTTDELTSEPNDDFTELDESTQKELGSVETNLAEAKKDVRKPKEDAVIGGFGKKDDDDAFPITIKEKPKGTLPQQTTLYPMPATAEAMAFDPSSKHSAKRQAAMEHTEAGRNALAQSKVELAIAKFQKAISIDPSCGYAYFYFARARFLQKDWDQVVALTEKATVHLVKDPSYSSRAYLMQAQALSNQKNYVGALAACESSIEADPTNVQAKLLRARLKKLY